MASKELNPAPSDALSNEEIVGELRELLKSDLFKSSGKLSQLLEYICNKKIVGQGDQLNEYLIGIEVFERKADFSASEDAIVRVRAHDLRRRLKDYYDSDGKEHSIQIILPKGRYCPEFVRLKPSKATTEMLPHPPAETPGGMSLVLANDKLKNSFEFLRVRKWFIFFGMVLLLSLGANVANIWIWTTSAPNPQTALSSSEAKVSFYQELFGPLDRQNPRSTQINLSNPAVMFSFHRDSPTAASYLGRTPQPIDLSLGRRLPLNVEDRINSSDPKSKIYYFLHATNDEYTGMGEASCAFYLAQLFQLLHRPVQLSQARFLNWEKANKENVILLGQPTINVWAGRNLSEPNFSYSGTKYINRHPEPGEQPFYQCELEDRSSSEGFVDYGLILMQGLPNGTWVLTLSGSSSYGTLGTGEFFCNSGKMKPVYTALKARCAGGEIPTNYEILIKIMIRENIPVDASFVACRTGAPAK